MACFLIIYICHKTKKVSFRLVSFFIQLKAVRGCSRERNPVILVMTPWIRRYWTKYGYQFLFSVLGLITFFYFCWVNSFCLAAPQESSTDPSKQVKLGFLTGLVPRGKCLAFERILFRATRGNVFLRQAVVENPVTDPVTGEKVLFLPFCLHMCFKNRCLATKIDKVVPFCMNYWKDIYIHIKKGTVFGHIIFSL